MMANSSQDIPITQDIPGGTFHSVNEGIAAVDTGDLHFTPPGYRMIIETGCEYIEFSPTNEMNEMYEVIKCSLKAMG